MTLDEALIHLGYDEADDYIRKLVGAELNEAEAYLKGAVGDDILELMAEDPRVDTLLKAYLDEQHDDRGVTSAKANNAKRERINSIEWQLRMELIRLREAGEV